MDPLSCIWIRSLADRAPYRRQWDRLLALDAVVRHEVIYGELLIGGRGGRRKFLDAYERLQQTRAIPHGELVEFV
jgi:hypothetical protein